MSVPTKGVFAEAVQGLCNACEKIETDGCRTGADTPIDEPTPISPITLPTPSPSGLAGRMASDFAAADREHPERTRHRPPRERAWPASARLLTTSGVFKDITGLDANQQNALRTYLSNQENAKAFAEMAKEMAMQHTTRTNSGKIMDSIASAKNSRSITHAEASQLVKDHLQQQIDGGSTEEGRERGAGQGRRDPAQPGSPSPPRAKARTSRQTGRTARVIASRSRSAGRPPPRRSSRRRRVSRGSSKTRTTTVGRPPPRC